MKISSHAIALIQNFEGLRTTAYKPVSSESGWTIGYGHHGHDVKKNSICTEIEAEHLLKSDLEKIERQVIAALNADEIEVTQGMFDALCSLLFNLSGKKTKDGRWLSPIQVLTGYKLWAKMKKGDKYGASLEFLDINKAGGVVLPGLTKRRQAEQKLFLS
jgi:GH24 family phage-related lysozyme (muramidase)